MTGAYQMAIVNSIASIIFLSGFLLYTYIYPKKKLPSLPLLISLSLLPLLSLLREGTYESGDLSIHATRAMFFYDSVFVDHVYPRWSDFFNFGYGSPHFNFAYFLPYLIISAIHQLGFSFITSVKLLLALFYIGSGISIYYWMKDEFGETPALIGAIFYQFAPYHLVDLHFRVTIAEIMSFAFLPLNLFFIRRIIKKGSTNWIIYSGISTSLLILSHQAITLIAMPFFAGYACVLWLSEKKKIITPLLRVLYSWILGFLLSAFFWVPIITEAKYTLQSVISDVWFPHFFAFIYSPWRYGLLFQGPSGELSYIIGYLHILVIILFTILFIRKKLSKNYLAAFLLLSFVLFFFLMQEMSKPFWDTFPIMKNFQFSYRILVLITLIMAAMAGMVAKSIKHAHILTVLCVATIGITILNWGNRRVIPEINDQYLFHESQTDPRNVPGLDEVTAPIWIDLQKTPYKVRPKQKIEIISGNAGISEEASYPNKYLYTITTSGVTKFRHNTLYFPGWNVIVNGQPKEILYKDSDIPGIIIFTLPKGTHTVEVSFGDTPVRTYGSLISITSATLLGGLVVIRLRKRV